MKPEILQALPAPITRTFHFMGIAEEEIDKAKRGPRFRTDVCACGRIHQVFGAAAPGNLLHYSDVLYRAHVRELCHRAGREEDLRPATSAEIVVALCQGSLIAPLDQRHTAVYEQLFFEIFGKYVGKTADVTREPYENSSSEIIHAMRRKFGNEERKLG